jgi:hypothetical protein
MRKTGVLKSAINDRIVCADRNIPSPIGNPEYHGVSIRANRDEAGPWEHQEFEFNNDGTISIRSEISDGITALWSADPELPGQHQYMVVANRPDKPSNDAGPAERWKPVFVREATRFNGSEKIENAWALQNVFNNEFMTIDPGDKEGKIFARGKAANENELFYSTVPLIASIGNGDVNPRPSLGSPLTPLVVRGRHFHDANGPFDYREISAFGLYERWRSGDMNHCAQYAAMCWAFGITSVRVILTLGGDYWQHIMGLTSGPSKAGFYDGLQSFARFMAERGIYVRFCLVGGLEEFGGFSKDREDVYSHEVHANVMDYVRQVMDRIGDEPNVLWNVANEWNQIGMRDSGNRIIDIGRYVKSRSSRPMNLTETNGPIADDPMWAREPADFVDAHLERWNNVGGFSWVKRSSESPVVDQDKMLMISGEPINLGSPEPGRPDDAQESPAVAFCYGGTSRVKRYVTNFHYHGGLLGDLPDEVTRACLNGWKRGLDAIPLTFPGGWCNGHHGCSPWDINNFPREGDNEETHQGPIRIFGLSGSEGYIGVSVAEREGRPPRAKRGVTVVDRVSYGGYSSAVYRA